MSVIAERPVFVYFLARFVRRHASFNCRSVIIDWPLIGVWREIPWPFSTFGVHCSFHGFARHVCFAPFFLFPIYSTVCFNGISNGELFGGCNQTERYPRWRTACCSKMADYHVTLYILRSNLDVSSLLVAFLFDRNATHWIKTRTQTTTDFRKLFFAQLMIHKLRSEPLKYSFCPLNE